MARVLVVDGDRDIRVSLIDLLSLDGYTVLEASTPEQARAILRTCPDCVVVIFDSGLPSSGAEGIGTLASAVLGLAGDASHLHAFICLTTSPAHLHERMRDTLGLEGIPVIQKPFDLDTLLDAVADAAAAVDTRNGVR